MLSLCRIEVTVCPDEENSTSTEVDVNGIARKSDAMLCKMGNVFFLLLHHLRASVVSLGGV